MDSTGRSARVLVFALCSACAAVALAVSLYYARDYKKKRKKGSTSNILDSSGKCEEPSSFGAELELAEILTENGRGEFEKGTISSLLEMLERVDDLMLEKLLVALLNCSAFTTNQVRRGWGLGKLDVCMVGYRGIGGDLDEHSQDILVHSRILSRNIGFH